MGNFGITIFNYSFQRFIIFGITIWDYFFSVSELLHNIYRIFFLSSRNSWTANGRSIMAVALLPTVNRSLFSLFLDQWFLFSVVNSRVLNLSIKVCLNFFCLPYFRFSSSALLFLYAYALKIGFVYVFNRDTIGRLCFCF